MQARYYLSSLYLKRITTGHHITTIFHGLQEVTNLKEFPKLAGTMSSFLDSGRKSVTEIKNAAANLKMKLLRSSVPQELFKNEINAIIDQCTMFISDSEKESQSISKSTGPKQSSSPKNVNTLEDLNIDANFFDEDPFDYIDTTTNVSKAPEKAPVGEKTALDQAIAKHKSKTESSRKRKSICLTEPVVTPAQSRQKDGNYIVDDDGWVTAFIDGSCLGNGKGGARAGLGVWFCPNSKLNLAEPVKGRLTNNVGEIEAAIRAIEQAYSVGITKLRLKTDSMFLINCVMKWRLTWEKNGWRTSANKPVINRTEIQKLTKTLDDTKVAVCWEHVKAHSNIIGNEAADLLAKQGAEKCVLRELLK